MGELGVAVSTVTRLSEGSPSVLLLSPMMMDARVWAELELPESFSAAAEVERIVDLVGDPDVVVAVGNEAAAAVHLAQLGRARAVVLIRPVHPRTHEEMLAEAKADSRDAAAAAALMVTHESSGVPQADRDRLRQMFEDNLPVLFARVAPGVDFAHFSRTWHETIHELDVPILVIGRASSSDPLLDAGTSRMLMDVAPHARLVTDAARGQLPWLEDTPGILRAVEEFLAGL